MKFPSYLLTILLIASSSAFGHGNPVPHNHPHSGISVTWIALIAAAGSIDLAFGYLARRRRRLGN